jgi:hypothetical protein
MCDITAQLPPTFCDIKKEPVPALRLTIVADKDGVVRGPQSIREHFRDRQIPETLSIGEKVVTCRTNALNGVRRNRNGRQQWPAMPHSNLFVDNIEFVIFSATVSSLSSSLRRPCGFPEGLSI